APAPAKPAAPAPAPAPSLPVAPVGSGAGAAIAAAQSVMGTPYRWAGASPSTGFDCSGLTMWAWARGGRSLPHSSSAQYAATQRISLDQLQPGDLVFFNNPISHVGLYIGGGQMIHSPHTGDVVKISPITRMGKLVRAGRVA
ncbi:MAG TPA: C40 family peptidase, partial [Microthrixaceae bacterium]|nr:C40 family peptidase [Microthrixaceae bacterium]